jgi:hypothetical protein
LLSLEITKEIKTKLQLPNESAGFHLEPTREVSDVKSVIASPLLHPYFTSETSLQGEKFMYTRVYIVIS